MPITFLPFHVDSDWLFAFNGLFGIVGGALAFCSPHTMMGYKEDVTLATAVAKSWTGWFTALLVAFGVVSWLCRNLPNSDTKSCIAFGIMNYHLCLAMTWLPTFSYGIERPLERISLSLLIHIMFALAFCDYLSKHRFWDILPKLAFPSEGKASAK